MWRGYFARQGYLARRGGLAHRAFDLHTAEFLYTPRGGLAHSGVVSHTVYVRSRWFHEVRDLGICPRVFYSVHGVVLGRGHVEYHPATRTIPHSLHVFIHLIVGFRSDRLTDKSSCKCAPAAARGCSAI